MATIRKRPPGAEAGGAHECSGLGAFERGEHNSPQLTLQAIRSAVHAAAVTSLAFETRRRA